MRHEQIKGMNEDADAFIQETTFQLHVHADPEPDVTPHVTTGGQCCPTEAAQVWA